jgi:biotin carboxyl carrier protein
MEEQKENQDPVKYESFQVYEGAKFKTLLTRKHLARKPHVPEDLRIVKSFIPGTIRKVFVKEGQPVKKGEKLCTLEAMKMVNLICAAMDGIVKIIHVKPGTLVSNKQVLVELEESGGKKKEKK